MKRTKKLLSLLLTFALVLTTAPWSWISVSAYDEPMLNAEGYYELSTADHLYWFAEQVNSGNNAINGVLMNDIVVNEGDLSGYDGVSENTWHEWTPIGNEEYFYLGTFDGAGYSVSGLYFNDATANFIGFFGIVDGIVKNVGVINSYFNGYMAVGGVCGYLYDYSAILEQSYSESSVNGTVYVGGVCGYNSFVLRDCYNTGKVSGMQYVGGICGYGVAAFNCYNVGNITGLEYVSSICGDGSTDNCFYLTNSVTNDNSQDGEVTIEQFESGEIAYLLNDGVTDGTQVWYQNLDKGEKVDTSPKFTGSTVYENEVCTPDGMKTVYSNTKSLTPHTFVDHVCIMCGIAQPAVLVTDDNYNELGLAETYIGYYAIADVNDLYWFADQVNNEQNINIKVVLLNDISINEGELSSYDGVSKNTWEEWTPIGSASVGFNGIFDGAGHKISGLYFNDTSASYVGLFGYAYSIAVIKNVGIENTYFNGSEYVGGVCGYNNGTVSDSYNASKVIGAHYVGGVCGYNHTMSECYNIGEIVGTVGIGGVCGYNRSVLYNCYNIGKVAGTEYIGGVCGYNYDTGRINDCYNEGSITGTKDIAGVCGGNRGVVCDSYSIGTVKGTCQVGSIVGYYQNSTTINCYYLPNTAVDGSGTYQNGTGAYSSGDKRADVSGSTTAKTANQFASGEVAYLLNEGVTDGTQVWYQNIDNGETVDTSPKFVGGTVYQYYNICPDEEVAYSNTENKKGKMHSFESGVCTECGVSFINPWKSQIRFDTNEDGTFAGTFDYRVLATITSDDLLSTFGTENIAIQSMVEAGFVMAKSDDVSDFDYEIAKNVVKGTSDAYTKVPVEWISTALDPDTSTSGAGDYVISCIVEDIPATDKNMCLATMAYIVYNDADGNLCYMFYPTINTVCFEGLYNQYYPLAFPS